MRVLIVGGGFIGNETARYAKNQGHQVAVWAPPEFDIRKAQNWELSLCELVMIFAAKTSESDFQKNPAESYDININGLRNVLEACKKGKVKRIMFASSAAVYGDAEIMSEDSPCLPKGSYGLSKLEGEKLADGATIIRFFNTYGVGEDHKGTSESMVSQFVKQAIRREVSVYGDGEQRRDFIHVKDAARIAFELSKNHTGVFNVGTGRSTSYNEILRILRREGLKFETEYVHNPLGKTYQMKTKADISKIKSLGLEPRISIEEGVSDLYIQKQCMGDK